MATSRRKVLAGGYGATEDRPPPGMSEDAGAYGSRATTQAAEGIPRLRWTLEEFERLGELGVFTEEDRVELIDGELVPMSPKGNRHELVRGAILNCLRRNLPNEYDLHVEPGWRLAGSYCEPDFLIGAAGCNPTTVAPAEVTLLIEVADTSFKKDSGPKSSLYARAGVRDYWVVNARSLTTRIYRQPSAKGYGSKVNVRPTVALVSLLIPAFQLRLADLAIG
ncbi:MAG TPA: Uma2 family endonuclease [Hyphomicrobiaceae bacterium]|nr:Uma2 family endonuclease [Hyphomicrobiaceae bacterium]